MLRQTAVVTCLFAVHMTPFAIELCGGYNYELTSIWRRSSAYQRSLRSQWCNPLAAVMLTYLFI